jgi:hypothetical protein
VIANVAVEPTLTVWVAGLAEIAKSAGATTVIVVAIACMVDPLVPKTVTVYTPGVEELQARVDVAEVVVEIKDRLAGFKAKQLNPEGIASVSATLLVKPPWLASVIVDDPDVPTFIVGLLLEDITKSWTAATSLIVRE